MYMFSASVVQYNTAGSKNYGQIWHTVGTEKSIVFKVKASEEAWILLSSQVENVDVGVYQVGLGTFHNTYTTIKRNLYNSEIVKDVMTGYTMSRDEMKTFWISWEGRQIQVQFILINSIKARFQIQNILNFHNTENYIESLLDGMMELTMKETLHWGP